MKKSTKKEPHIEIPVFVDDDRRLKPNEKLMFARIAALAWKDGFCFAGNAYFAERYGLSPSTVRSYISNLEKCGYIKCEYGKEKNKFIRKIYLLNSQHPAENVAPCQENLSTLPNSQRGTRQIFGTEVIKGSSKKNKAGPGLNFKGDRVE